MGFRQDNPILVGCVAALAVGTLAVGALVLLASLGLRACDSVSVLDSIAGTARDANSAGFSLHVSVINGESTLEMHPHQSREVTCDELWGVVEPHLESPQAELTIYSSTLVVQPDGTQTEIPLECSRTDEPVGEAI